MKNRKAFSCVKMEFVRNFYEDIRIGIEHYPPILKTDVPGYIWEMLFSISCMYLVLIIDWKGNKSGRYIFRLLLAEYIFLLYCVTIFYRTEKDCYEFNYMPFWSYDHSSYEVQSVMNVMVFIPIGLLIGFSFRKLSWWKPVLTGCLLSVSIELLQLLSKRGFSELDDVIHNTLGCMIGSGIYGILRAVYERASKSIWQFCSYLFWPQRRPRQRYEI